MPNVTCIECDSAIDASATHCVCGWLKKNTTNNHRCAYQLRERQCPLPGRVSKARNTWYCPDHYRCIENNDRTGAEGVLRDADNLLQQFQAQRSDWRDVLCMNRYKKYSKSEHASKETSWEK